MNKCGYYSCYKGKPTCNHPTYGEDNTKQYRTRLHNRCNSCRIQNFGIYPSQVPKSVQTNWVQEVIDSKGNVIN